MTQSAINMNMDDYVHVCMNAMLQLEPGALCLTNSESDCDAAMSTQKRQTKPRHTDKRDRHMRYGSQFTPIDNSVNM